MRAVWLVLAALAAVAVVGQAVARQASAESADHPVLSALGEARSRPGPLLRTE